MKDPVVLFYYQDFLVGDEKLIKNVCNIKKYLYL